MKLGIIGHGVVGSALSSYFKDKHEVAVYDPPKKLFDDLSGCQAYFICVPVPTRVNGLQDISIIDTVIKNVCNLEVPVFVRSTVLPGTCDRLSTERLKKGGAPVVAMPEFLTERKAKDDVKKHPILCGNQAESLVREIFKTKKVIFTTNTEAELAKYAHNSLAAISVNHWNVVYTLSQWLDRLGLKCNYENVVNGTMLSGFFTKAHTKVPGPDGNYGYGGKCLPKDLKAFIKYLHSQKEYIEFNSLLGTEKDNAHYRERVVK